MSGTGDSRRRWKPPIDAAAKCAFLAALRVGAPQHEAAAAGGYALNSFYRVARSDLDFRAAWDEAHAVSAELERGSSFGRSACPSTSSGPNPAMVHIPEQARGGAELGEERIVPGNRRVLQRRRMRHVRFDEERQQKFLGHFAQNCDTIAAAAAAGVCESTVYVHRRKNPAFASAFRDALNQGYDLLEAETLRQRLEAQRRFRAILDQASPGAAPLAPADVAAEFERVLKLLARWDRKGRAPERRASPEGPRRVWTFDAAIELLGERLEALGVEVPPLPPDEAARYDGPAEGERRP